jgi:hypothetical protein
MASNTVSNSPPELIVAAESPTNADACGADAVAQGTAAICRGADALTLGADALMHGADFISRLTTVEQFVLQLLGFSQLTRTTLTTIFLRTTDLLKTFL